MNLMGFMGFTFPGTMENEYIQMKRPFVLAKRLVSIHNSS
jgi:hypothetical protein